MLQWNWWVVYWTLSEGPQVDNYKDLSVSLGIKNKLLHYAWTHAAVISDWFMRFTLCLATIHHFCWLFLIFVSSYHSHLRAGGYREGAEACWLATIADDERPAIKEHPVKMLFTHSFLVELAQFYSSNILSHIWWAIWNLIKKCLVHITTAKQLA